ncbi:MAG: KH domain-containing protein [Firmicutes bacterium]|nr:KH domain-containing protein [Bacillota bacterium]
MTKLVEAIAKSLVDKPENVVVTETASRQGTVIELKVDPDDMGKVIGKQGRIAKALRVVVKAAATRENKKVTVEIVKEKEAAEAEEE